MGCSGPDQKTKPPSCFDRQLQTSENTTAASTDSAERDGNTPRTKRLFQRPKGLVGFVRPNHNHVFQIHPHDRGGRWVEIGFPIDDHQRAPCLQDWLGRKECQQVGSSRPPLRQPFDDCASPETSRRQQLVERTDSGGNDLVVSLLPVLARRQSSRPLNLLQLLLQPLQRRGPRFVSCHSHLPWAVCPKFCPVQLFANSAANVYICIDFCQAKHEPKVSLLFPPGVGSKRWSCLRYSYPAKSMLVDCTDACPPAWRYWQTSVIGKDMGNSCGGDIGVVL